MSIYVSTGAFRSRSLPEVVQRAEQLGLTHLELSSGLAPTPDFDAYVPMLESSRLKFAVHNYFPPPERPFVLNLGSPDADSLAQSRAHARRAIALAARLGGTYYSVHSPFALALTPELLGNPTAQAELGGTLASSAYDRVYALFVESLRLLLPFANDLGLKLLVENNVASPRYFQRNDRNRANPFLMATADELERLISDVAAPNLAVLVDTGHLKVSATALNFDCGPALARLLPFTHVFHLSDNDGLEDQNLPVTDSAWFWPYLKDMRNCDVVIEAYRLEDTEIGSQLELMRKRLGPDEEV